MKSLVDGSSTKKSTRQAHIAMFSHAAHGHVNPSLGGIRELVARGYRVTYAIPPTFADKVAETGAEIRLWNSTLPSPEGDQAAWGHTRLENAEMILADAIQALPQLKRAYAGDEPDLILHDFDFYPGRVLAHNWGISVISLSPKHVALKGHEDVVASEPLWAEQKKTERGRSYYAHFQTWLQENGITEHPDHFAGRPTRSLVLISKALQPHADKVDESVHTFVGSCLLRRTQQPVWKRPAGAEKVVLVSLGSFLTNRPGFYRQCVEAFSTLPGWHLLLQIGQHVDPAQLGEKQDNVEVRSWIPQTAVLEETDLFVTHAGSSSIQEALATGTPMIAVPQEVHTVSNADMLQGLGVARHMSKDEATATTLRATALALIDDPEVARRLYEIQTKLASEGGARRMADLIEAELPADKRRRQHRDFFL